MNAKYADSAYIEKAKSLTAEETERVLSRMGDKLRKKKFKDKIDCLAAVAIQLEIEDDMLSEWRENFTKIKAKHDKKEVFNAPELVPVKPKEEPKAEDKPKPTAMPKRAEVKPSAGAKKATVSSSEKPEAKAKLKKVPVKPGDAVKKEKNAPRPKLSPMGASKPKKMTAVKA